MPIDITDFDLLNVPPGFAADPYPWLAALRDRAPVHRNPDGTHVLTRYDDLVAIYRDPGLWSSDKTVDFAPRFGPSAPLYEHHTTSVVFTDPPDHTRISAALMPHELKYSRFIHGLSLSGVTLNRKQISELAIHDPAAFEALVGQARTALG